MRKYVTAMLTAAVLACGGDKATGPNATIAGNYTLRTVNGANVPAVVFQNQTEKDEVTGGNVNLSADQTWSGAVSVRATNLSTGGVLALSVPVNGTYTTSGSSITLTNARDGSQITGTVDAGTLTVGADVAFGVTLTLVFKK